ERLGSIPLTCTDVSMSTSGGDDVVFTFSAREKGGTLGYFVNSDGTMTVEIGGDDSYDDVIVRFEDDSFVDGRLVVVHGGDWTLGYSVRHLEEVRRGSVEAEGVPSWWNHRHLGAEENGGGFVDQGDQADMDVDVDQDGFGVPDDVYYCQVEVVEFSVVGEKDPQGRTEMS
ncbi:hypothetical protein HKX48_001673, partial [Thoreauomyces humboldtii]